MDDSRAIQAILQAVNDAWQNAPPHEIPLLIGDHFADDAVFAGPGLRRVARGRDAVCKSYEDFVTQTTVLEVDLTDPEIDVMADVAVATLTWRMRYEYQGRQSKEAGHDIYVFAKREGRWLICWRALSSQPTD